MESFRSRPLWAARTGTTGAKDVGWTAYSRLHEPLCNCERVKIRPVHSVQTRMELILHKDETSLPFFVNTWELLFSPGHLGALLSSGSHSIKLT